MLNDELKIYRGENFVVSKHIVIHQPSLNEICNYGEREYFSMVHSITATPQSMKARLWDIGIDYTKITSYELFCNVLIKMYPQEKTSILLGDLDLISFQLMKRNDGTVFLRQFKDSEEIIIDELTYNIIVDYLRKVHDIYKDEKIPGNETTKMILIEDDREENEKNKHIEYHSQLKNLISAMINCEGFKYNHSEVWNMKINAFIDSVKRIHKIKNSELLLQSGYSGFGVNLKDIPDKQLNWLSELD